MGMPVYLLMDILPYDFVCSKMFFYKSKKPVIIEICSFLYNLLVIRKISYIKYPALC